MNILWISHNVPYPPKTGVLQRNYNLLREAARLGNVYLIAFFQEGILPIEYDFEEVNRELGKLCKHIEILPMPNISSQLKLYLTAAKSIFTSNPFSINCMISSQMHTILSEISQKHSFDVVHFDTISLAEYRKDISADAATVLNHHNIESFLMARRSKIENTILRKAYYTMEAHKLKHYESEQCLNFDVNFTVSEIDAKTLQSISSKCQTRVIANGVDIDYFDFDESKIQKKNLIMVSGMNWYPNRDAVLWMGKTIWPLLKKEIPGVTWTIVGADPPQKIIELSESDADVELTGFVDDVRPYIKKAEVYLCPMRDGGGTRLKILDALSMGKAIVSTSLGLEGIDVIPDVNALVADTADEFVQQIKKVIQNPSLRTSLGVHGRELVECKYSWKVIGRNLEAVYRELVAHRYVN